MAEIQDCYSTAFFLGTFYCPHFEGVPDSGTFRTNFKNLAERQHIKTLQIEPERGIIFDRNGEKLAASTMVSSVFADPAKISNSSEVAELLAPILNIR